MRSLTKSEREELLSELRQEDNKKYADRIRTVLLLDKAWPIEQIAEVLFISIPSIHRYRKPYEEGGVKQLIQDGNFSKRTSLSSDDLSTLEDTFSTAGWTKLPFLVRKGYDLFMSLPRKITRSKRGVLRTKILRSTITTGTN